MSKTLRNLPPQSVAGAIFSEDRSSILLILRRDVPVWVLPGGGIDKHESSEEAIVREILEETGFHVKIDRLVGDYIPINRLSKRTHLFECSVLKGNMSSSAETLDVRFFPLYELPPLPPPYPEWIVEAFQKKAPLFRKLSSVSYPNFIKHAFLHPLLVLRFLLARMGLPINKK